MKILNINKFHFRNGGADMYYLDLGAMLRAQGEEVIDFAMRHPRNEHSDYADYFPSRVDFSGPQSTSSKARAIARMMWSSQAAGNIDKLIKDTRPDVAHIHNIYHHLSPSILTVLKKHGIPVVMTVHDFKLICPTYNLFAGGKVCERCKGHRYYQPIKTRCNNGSLLGSSISAAEMTFHKLGQFYENNVERFITSTQFVKNKLVEFGQDSNQIEVIPMALASMATSPSSQTPQNNQTLGKSTVPIRNESSATNGEFLLYVGRLHPTKGVDVLLNAVQVLRHTYHMGTPLKIAGSGPQETALKQQAKQLGLSNVQFLGRQNKTMVNELLKDAKTVIVPSVYYETFCLSAAEAMAEGKVVIASNHGSLQELIRDGKTGYLFAPGNHQALARKIKDVLQNPLESAKLGQAARAEAQKKYHPSAHLQKVLELYDRLQKPEKRAKIK